MDEGEPGGVASAVLCAALCALAGPRRGDAVTSAGAPPRALRALLAATGTAEVAQDAALALAGGAAADARTVAPRLRPGGRVVALAPDASTASARARELGLDLRHVEAVGPLVAWSAVSPLRP